MVCISAYRNIQSSAQPSAPHCHIIFRVKDDDGLIDDLDYTYEDNHLVKADDAEQNCLSITETDHTISPTGRTIHRNTPMTETETLLRIIIRTSREI